MYIQSSRKAQYTWTVAWRKLVVNVSARTEF